MPANLSPDYFAAEREYREAQTQAEKISALERMLATIPKHKGTDCKPLPLGVGSGKPHPPSYFTNRIVRQGPSP